MSLINDALKQARKVPPRQPGVMPPMRPVDEDPDDARSWLVPGIIIGVILLAIFFTGWSLAHRAVNDAVTQASAEAAAQPPAEVLPDAKPESAPPPPPAEPLNPQDAPVLQGIFYSPTAPSAIVDGKTVRPGDQFKQYRVKEISKYTVTLVGPDGKAIKIGMGN